MRKLLLAVAATLVVLLLALVLVPLAFRGRLEARVRAAVARSVDARVDWTGIGVGLIRDFPDATLRVREPTVAGVGAFAGDTLLRMRELRLVLDVGSVVRSLRSGAPIVVREIVLDEPVVRLRVLADGRANWDIARDSDSTDASGSGTMDISLRLLEVHGGSLTLRDSASRLDVSLDGLRGSLRGDFARQRFTIESQLRADSTSVRFAGVPWLSRAALALDGKVDADMAAHRFTLDRVGLRLNQLALSLAGAVTTAAPHPVVDIAFSSPGTAFADILSLVPAVYKRDFDQVRTSGRMAVSGRIRGAVKPDTLPAFAIRARVTDGAFQYRSLPLPARGILLDLALDNPGGPADATVVTLERLRATIGTRRVDGRLVLRTPVSDPDVDLRLVGSLDLADLARTVKLEDTRTISGILAADVAIRARVSDVDARRHDRVDAGGTVNASRIAIRSATLAHPLAIDTVALRLTPRTTELRAIAARFGRSDITASGALDNLLGFVLRGDELRGRATAHSRRVVLDELVPRERSGGVVVIPGQVVVTLDASADRVDHGALVMNGVRGTLRLADRRATFDRIRMQTLGGSAEASGFYETRDPTRPAFDLSLQLAGIDIPSAFAALPTFQRLAPIGRRATGTIGGNVTMAGAMDSAMAPIIAQLDGRGTVDAANLGLAGSRVFGRLADALKVERLRNPAIGAARLTFAIVDGRVTVQPFPFRMAGLDLVASGSHGAADGTLAYDLELLVPDALVDGAARGAIGRLATRAGRAGVDLASGEGVRIAARVTGTVTDPAVSVSFAGVAASLREAVRETVRERVDSAADAARARARADAARMIAEAEAEAAELRARARAAADTLMRRAGERADSLVARTTNPIARRAAEVAADRMKREAAEQAARAISAAEARGDSVVARARQRADSAAARP